MRLIDVSEYSCKGAEINWIEHDYHTINIHRKPLYEIPTVDAAPVKHGRWLTYKYDEEQYETVIVPWDGKGIPYNIFCSECRKPALQNGHEEDVDSNYCPNCGTKMDLEEQDAKEET